MIIDDRCESNSFLLSFSRNFIMIKFYSMYIVLTNLISDLVLNNNKLLNY